MKKSGDVHETTETMTIYSIHTAWDMWISFSELEILNLYVKCQKCFSVYELKNAQFMIFYDLPYNAGDLLSFLFHSFYCLHYIADYKKYWKIFHHKNCLLMSIWIFLIILEHFSFFMNIYFVYYSFLCLIYENWTANSCWRVDNKIVNCFGVC